jgi:outer membrane protein OmpA-like peptidoglycan-associated protein
MRRWIGFALATGMLAASPSYAQTIGFSEAVGILADNCKQDIAKHCAKVNIAGGRIMRCLEEKQASISAACKGSIGGVVNLVSKRSAARAALAKTCDADRLRLCAGVVPGDGNLLECFDQVKANVSPACRKVVEDAGFDVPLATGPVTDQIQLSSEDLVTSMEGLASGLNADKLRQLASASIKDPNRKNRANRPPLDEHLNSQAQLTIAVQFDFDSARINPNSYRALGLIADAMYHPHLQGYCFLIVGHTDATGSREYNLKLSGQRADAIKEALIKPFGISPARVSAVGLGEEQLLDPARPDAAENRRVQIVNVGQFVNNNQCAAPQ